MVIKRDCSVFWRSLRNFLETIGKIWETVSGHQNKGKALADATQNFHRTALDDLRAWQEKRRLTGATILVTTTNYYSSLYRSWSKQSSRDTWYASMWLLRLACPMSPSSASLPDADLSRVAATPSESSKKNTIKTNSAKLHNAWYIAL